MARIDKLTKEQTARFGEWSEKWIKIGLSTEPADFDRATAAALQAYKLCNLKRPMVVLRMGSPYGATVGGAMAWAMLRELGKQVRSQVESQVWSQVGSQVESQVESLARDGLNNDRGGSLWSSWGAYVSFFRDVCGWADPILEKFAIDEALIDSCGWTWWHENVLAISDRPNVIRRDAEGRLHCENGPSIAYRDGWALHHWHGVSIPEEWLTGKKPTAQEALTWKNVEQRRAAAEIVGWTNILQALDAKVIDTDADEEIGTLLEANIPDSGPERFLSVKCGTGRRFCLPVPREMETAHAANAWSYGLDRLSFKPEVRT